MKKFTSYEKDGVRETCKTRVNDFVTKKGTRK